MVRWLISSQSGLLPAESGLAEPVTVPPLTWRLQETLIDFYLPSFSDQVCFRQDRVNTHHSCPALLPGIHLEVPELPFIQISYNF